MGDEEESIAPALERRFYAAGDWTIHARVATDGNPPVVLIHGIAVSSRYMVPLAQALASDFDVYVPDLPGIGKSSKPRDAPDIHTLARCLEGFLDDARLDRVLFVGNSFGCQVLVEFALCFPERVRALVLQGPTIDPHARTWGRQVLRWLADGPRERNGIRLLLTLLRDYWDCGPRRALQLFRYSLADPIDEKLPHIGAPAVVVRGSRDPIVPQIWAQEAANLLPAGRLAVVAGAAHTINFGAPLELARVVRSVARELEVNGA